MSRRLSDFHGGLHLEFHKDISTREPVRSTGLPTQLVLPLQQHIGHAAEPMVDKGDRVLKGQMIASAFDYVSAPIHAPTSGAIIAIEERPVSHPSGKQALCIVIEPDGQDEWCEKKTAPDYQSLDPSALRNLIRDAGIVGLGGAGFPSYIKLNPGPNKVIGTLILNGAECEPYISCDAMLMQERPREIIEGAKIMRHALKAHHCVIGIEDNKPLAISALRRELTSEEATFIEICEVPTKYPAGGEKQLIKVITGKEVPSHGLPVDIGVVCHNVATAAAVYRAVMDGEPLISRIVTISGEQAGQPCNLDVLIGTPVEYLLSETKTKTGTDLDIVIGGPMMGYTLQHMSAPVIKTTNCILVRKQQVDRQPMVMPCIRCGECARVCPANLLPQQLYWHAHARELDKAQEYNLFDCIECGCCAYVCPSHIPLVHYYRFAKTEIGAQEKQKKKSDIARQRHEFRLERMDREKREKEERQRQKKEKLKKVSAENSSEEDAKKAAIQAAMDRVKARREEQNASAKNTSGLNEEQQKAIAEADERRKRMHKSESESESEKE